MAFKGKGSTSKNLKDGAFYAGREGFRVNSHNPYPANSSENKEWERGYTHQYFIELKRNANHKNIF